MEPVSFKDLGLFVAIVILSINPLMSVANWFRPQKREVSYSTEYATRAALEEVRGDVEQVDGKVEALKGEIIRNGENRRQAIESKVEAARMEAREDNAALREDLQKLSRELAAASTETRMLNQRYLQMTDK